MKNKGFISINRALKEHWVYQDPHALKLWVTLLFVVNYKEGKLKLGNKLYTIQRGQSSMSLRSLANQSGTSVKKLVSILKLFEEENMIKRKTIGKGKQSTTLITIENYDEYQGYTETLEKHNGNVRETLEGTQGERNGNTKGVQLNNSNNSNKEISNNNEIPSFESFKEHAYEKLRELGKSNLFSYDFAIKAKYEAWKENNWHDGNNKPIIRWKSKLTNTVKFLDPSSSTKKHNGIL